MTWFLACSASIVPGGDPPDTSSPVDSAADTAGDTALPADTGTTLDDPLPFCVNEWMPSNASSVATNVGHYEDWIELHNPGTEVVSLAGYTVSTDRADDDPDAIEALDIEPGAFAFIWASGEEGEGEWPVTLAAAGGELALFAPDGRGTILTWGSVATDFSVARATDCCTGDDCLGFVYRGTPGTTNVPPSTREVTVLGAGSTWRYLDTGVDPGSTWNDVGFDDSAWASGPAPLGYGDDGMGTTLGYGSDANNKYITTWYRTTTSILDVGAVTSATVGIRRDDGAVVYLNGTEAFRTNVSEGPVDASTLASSSAGSYNETAYFEFPVDTSLLVEGDNLVAVEVHQHAATSSDLVMDAWLSVERL
ncbi:MAG: hypothetical protein FJ102_15260 [Deltaproteobacteria bacterium]|nr:hypothetical protein [Deltaproteobacteria bacterium]